MGSNPTKTLPKSTSSEPPDVSAATSLDSIVDLVLDRHPQQLPDESALWNSFPDHMPALYDQLKRARVIRQASELAQSLPPTLSEMNSDTSTARDDIAYLQKQLPDYEFHDKLGRGGQASVYEAIQRSTNRPVAIKLLRHGPLAGEAERARFQRELNVIARLRHPNIVSVFMGGVVDGQHWFSMECIEEAESLDDYLLLKQPSLREFIVLFEQVVRAIAYAHQQAVIHRDIKPSNVLVDCHGIPRVVDFGLAKIMNNEETSDDLSQHGQILGTLPYLSPEQITHGSGQVDVRSDVYAMGVMLYKLLAGRFPYSIDGTPEDIRQNICGAVPESIRGTQFAPNASGHSTDLIPHDLEKIVFKSLEKEKERRYQSALALADDLACYLHGDAVSARGADHWYQARKTLKKHKRAVIVAASFVALLVTSLVVLYSQWQRAEAIAYQYQLGLDAASYARWGSVARDAGRNEDAIAMFEKAIEISRLADRATPVLLAARVDACQRMGIMYYTMNEIDRGDRILSIAQAAMKEFESQGDENLRLRSQLLVHRLAAEGARRRKDRPRQIDESLKALEICNRLMATSPSNADMLRLKKNCLIGVSTAYLDSENLAMARLKITELQNLIQELMRRDPKEAECDLDEMMCRIRLAQCAMLTKTADGFEAGIMILSVAQRQHKRRVINGRFKDLLQSAESIELDLRTLRAWGEKQLKNRFPTHRPSWSLIF
ncbi:MAG: serine/threonine-protein kinase [Planctomycetota bacterium]